MAFNQEGIGRLIDKLDDLSKFIMKSLIEYKNKFSPEDLARLKDEILKLIGKSSDSLENFNQVLNSIAQKIEVILKLTSVILTAVLVGAAYLISFKIGQHFSRSFQLTPNWKPTKADLAFSGGAVLAVWLPGMSTWGSVAGPVLMTTSVGTVALVPTLIAGAAITGWYLGRRIWK